MTAIGPPTNILGPAPPSNMSIGFALFDNRTGPTEDEVRIQQNIDGLSAFVRLTLMRCERIRTVLKLGPPTMPVAQQQIAADMMDLWFARPVQAEGRARYCYPKLVSSDSNAHEMFHTYFWTPEGQRLTLDTVLGYRNFHIVPFVEVEDVFVSKALRSMQLKLRECIVYLPPERLNVRSSVCFPDQLCTVAPQQAAAATEPPMPSSSSVPTVDVPETATSDEAPPPAKRMRCAATTQEVAEETDAPAEEEEEDNDSDATTVKVDQEAEKDEEEA